MGRELTFGRALAIYVALFLALTHPFWMFGEVVAPYRFAGEAGTLATPSAYLENAKFSDYWHFFIPEIQNHMQGPRSGWLALWTSNNEMGRPLYHGGFSSVYFPAWVVLKFTGNPARLLTVMSLAYCFLTGLFLLFLCKELALKPLAGLIAAVNAASAPLLMYWLTFPMFPATLCWSAGALYALARMARREVDVAGGAVLAFSCYSLFIVAYPQAVVFNAYLLTGYLLWSFNRRRKSAGTASAVKYLGTVAVFGVSGILLSAPVILDIADTVARSSRIATDPSFFVTVLPSIDSIAALLRIFSLGTFPELLANPVAPSFPFPYDGLSITPVVLFLAFFGLLRCARETWGWWLAIVMICAFGFIHPLYEFGIRHLGFNLSRGSPLGTIFLPLAIISAYAVNALVPQSGSRTAAARMSIFATALSFAVVLGFYWSTGLPIRWSMALTTAAVVLLLAGTLVWPLGSFALIAALIVTGVFISFPLMLRLPANEVMRNSDPVDAVMAATPPGARIALIAPGVALLPPNSNAIFGVASVHGYDSLSSRQYQRLLRELGGETKQYGRWNDMIAPDYGSQVFWMSNIGLVISPTPILHPNLESVGAQGALHLYRVLERMGCCFQSTTATGAGLDDFSLAGREGTRPTRTSNEGDTLEFELHDYPDKDSVLTLSQQYHPYWRASVRTASGWQAARTIRVQDFFQGVVIPANARLVRLEFLPFARFAWLAHVFWVIALLYGCSRLASSALRPGARSAKFG
ncbi:MAG TPA: hypothetical protein VGP39_19335 [Bradyrhizobium sp.]|jgi:hypothetical protein|nr:hypothetical protein [Bradyrhizobium sp.]